MWLLSTTIVASSGGSSSSSASGSASLRGWSWRVRSCVRPGYLVVVSDDDDNDDNHHQQRQQHQDSELVRGSSLSVASKLSKRKQVEHEKTKKMNCHDRSEMFRSARWRADEHEEEDEEEEEEESGQVEIGTEERQLMMMSGRKMARVRAKHQQYKQFVSGTTTQDEESNDYDDEEEKQAALKMDNNTTTTEEEEEVTDRMLNSRQALELKQQQQYLCWLDYCRRSRCARLNRGRGDKFKNNKETRQPVAASIKHHSSHAILNRLININFTLLFIVTTCLLLLINQQHPNVLAQEITPTIQAIAAEAAPAAQLHNQQEAVRTRMRKAEKDDDDAGPLYIKTRKIVEKLLRENSELKNRTNNSSEIETQVKKEAQAKKQDFLLLQPPASIDSSSSHINSTNTFTPTTTNSSAVQPPKPQADEASAAPLGSTTGKAETKKRAFAYEIQATAAAAKQEEQDERRQVEAEAESAEGSASRRRRSRREATAAARFLSRPQTDGGRNQEDDDDKGASNEGERKIAAAAAAAATPKGRGGAKLDVLLASVAGTGASSAEERNKLGVDEKEEEVLFRFESTSQEQAKLLLKEIEQQQRGSSKEQDDKHESSSSNNKDLGLLGELRRRQLPFQLILAPPPNGLDTSGSSFTTIGRRRKRSQPQQQQGKSERPPQAATVNSTGNNNNNNKTNQPAGYRTNVIIMAFNYKLRLNLELNDFLFSPALIQKHFLLKGVQQISTQKIEPCYYHAKTEPNTRPFAIGAFRTCNGLSGVIHVNNETFVIHPLTELLSKKRPHIIYRYQVDYQDQSGADTDGLELQQNEQTSWRFCPSTRLHEWAFKKYNKLETSGDDPNESFNSFSSHSSSNSGINHQQFKRRSDDEEKENENLDEKENSSNCNKHGDRTQCDRVGKNKKIEQPTNKVVDGEPTKLLTKRDVSLTRKYIELALVLSQDMFDKRNFSTRLEVLHDAIQIVNCLDLYFRSANTRVSLVYVETWAQGDQIEISPDVNRTLFNFLEYSSRTLYKVFPDAAHLLTGGYARQFAHNEMGMAFPDSICSNKAVSVSQEAGIFEPFIAASTMAHMLGHNLGMEHDQAANPQAQASTVGGGLMSSATPTNLAQLHHNHQQQLLQPTTEVAITTSETLKIAQQKHRHNHNAYSSSSNEQEEQDEEIKSRSVSGGGGGPLTDDEESPPIMSQPQGSYGYSDDYQQEYCQSNCLMAERLAYVQPPASIGNMIQQQVSSGGNSGGWTSQLYNQSNSIFTMISSPVDGNSNSAATIVSVDQHGSMSSLGGINHSNADQWEQHLMNNNSKNLSSTRFSLNQPLPYKFSRNSIKNYHRLLRSSGGICLFNEPNKPEDFKKCGNGIVEQGEDCDCGKFRECAENDSCCDPITCRFKVDAECISGACCDRCQLRPKGFVCRKARGECDLDEQCDGKSGQCGADIYKQNGFPCSNGLGYCYLGQCPQQDTQCVELWASDARRSHQLCFVTFNTNGTIRGNCGYDASTKTYKRCDRDHLMCGTLQCQMGDMKPAIAPMDWLSSRGHFNNNNNNEIANRSVPEYSTKTIKTHDNQQYECKVITGSVGSVYNHGHMSDHPPSSASYVRDGSKCAPNKVCFNKSCQPMEAVYRDTFELCPRDERGRFCSNNGVCSSANRCHCEPGWMGHDCSQKATLEPPVTVQTTSDNMMVQDESLSSTLNSNNSRSLSQIHPSATYLDQPSAENVLKSLVPPTANFIDQLVPNVNNNNSSGVTLLTPPVNLYHSRSKPSFGTLVGTNATPLPEPILVPTPSISPPAQDPQPVTEPSTTTTTTTTTPAPSASSTKQGAPEKKKHDALGAPTLVLILVTIVAAVYLGFAMMANCYRRKGFIKPDKVLRHHQMNCKMDAMRNSFIAKRLADAALAVNMEGGGVTDTSGALINSNNLNGSSSTTTTNPSLTIFNGFAGIQNGPLNSESLINPYISPPNTGQPLLAGIPPPVLPNPFQQQFASEEDGGMLGGVGDMMSDNMMSDLNTFESKQQQQQARMNPNNEKQFAATVHYFDKLNNQHSQQQAQHPCMHQQLAQPNTSSNNMDMMMSYKSNEHISDHVPLLMSAGDVSSKTNNSARRILGSGGTSSFNNSNQKQNHNSKLVPSDWNQQNQLAYQQAMKNQIYNHEQQQQQQQQNLFSKNVGSFGSRTTSLGDVTRKNSLYHEQEPYFDQGEENVDAETAHHRSLVHRTLATPLRINRAHKGARVSPLPQVTPISINFRQSAHNIVTMPLDDYSSAPSSPEHRVRESRWSEADRNRTQRGSMAAPYSLCRQASQGCISSLSNSNLRQQQLRTGYHEDVILDALAINSESVNRQRKHSASRQTIKSLGRFGDGEYSGRGNHGVDEDKEMMPPLPPPPPTLSSHHHLMSGIGHHQNEMSDEAEDECDEDDDSEMLLSNSQSHQLRHQHQRPLSQHKQHQLNGRQTNSTFATQQRYNSDQQQAANSATSTMAKTVRKIPLNTGDTGGSVLPSMQSLQGFEQLSLVAQLQQLERVQSLHQKQVNANTEAQLQTMGSNKNLHLSASIKDGGHEFFSLPLSVQLSALLARSLREQVGDDSSSLINQLSIEDYLDNLNSSNVATSSRRSFKRSSQSGLSKEQQSETPSSRHKVKLQNLQSLINRLQKLHNQTMLQQQLEELTGELDEDLFRATRQTTLSRNGRTKSVSRMRQRTSDDLLSENHITQSHPQEKGNNSRREQQERKLSATKGYVSTHKNDSIYSMSDSEDGAAVSRLMVSYQKKGVANKFSKNQNPLTNKVIEDHNDELVESSQTPSSPVPPSSPPPPLAQDMMTPRKSLPEEPHDECLQASRAAESSIDSSVSTNNQTSNTWLHSNHSEVPEIPIQNESTNDGNEQNK